MTANTASEPPTTYAAQRRRAAKPASGISEQRGDRDRTARVNTSAARLYDVSERTYELAPRTARTRAGARRRRARPSACRSTIGSSQSMKSAAGTNERAERERARARRLLAPTAPARRGSPTNGIQRKIAYVGCTTASTKPGGGRRRDEPARWRAHRLERERERGRHEQLPRRRRRKREEDVRAALPGREADHRDLRGRRRRRPPRSAGRAPTRPRTR